MTQSRDPSTGKFLSNICSKLSPKQEEVLLAVHKRVTVCLVEHIYGHDAVMNLPKKKKAMDLMQRGCSLINRTLLSRISLTF